MFHLSSVAAVLLASVPLYVNADLTALVGTWSSGSMQVQTGPGFANPANVSFTYTNVSGISYSFTGADEGYWYEIARYRFTSNGSQPSCITAVMNWVHGTYAEAENGSIILTPNGDGYQQIQDPCAADSNFFENYNETELLASGWYPYTDATKGSTLQLYQFDGSPLAPVYQVYTTPNMLPLTKLRNVAPATTVLSRRSSGSQPSRQTVGGTALALITATLSLAAGSILL